MGYGEIPLSHRADPDLMSDEPEEVYPPCRCGREIRKLNAASDTPKCVGCGYPEEVCRCE